MSSLAEGTARNLDEVNEVTYECTYETEFESMVARKDNLVTLLNFDPTCDTKKFLNSPRSIKACVIKGVEEWELLCKTKEELADEVIPAKFQAHRGEFLELKANFYEKNRQSRLQECIKARNKLIQQEQNSVFQTETSPLKRKERSYSGIQFSPQKVFDSGRKHFQVMQRKQMQEIDNIIYDNKLQEAIDLKQEYNQEKKEKMKEVHKIQVSYRERENAEAKVRREQKKRELSEERDRSLKSRRNHEVCFHTKEESETAKQAENAIMELLWEMTGQADGSKGQFVDSKEILNRRISGIVEAEEKKKKLFQNKLIEKMLKNEERKKQIENEKMVSMEYRRLSAGIKQENVVKAQMMKEQIMTERDIKYHNKLNHNDKTKQRIDRERSVERQLRSLQESQRSEQVRYRAKIEEMEKELKNQYLFQEITADHHRAQKQRKEVLESKREQHMMKYLQEEEARQNFLRKEKSDKYQREQVETKIQIHSERVTSRSREREHVRQETLVASRKVSQSRQEIQAEYKKVKQKVEKSLYAQNLTNRSQRTNRSMNGSPSNSFSRLRTDSPLRILTQTRSSPDSRHEYAFTEFSPHKIRSPTTMTMTEPTTASTPIKSSRAPSICHGRTNSMVGSVVSYEVIMEEESHNLMMSMTPSAPQTTTNKPERRSRAQRGSMPVVKANIIESSMTKYTNNTRVNSRETSRDKKEMVKPPQMVMKGLEDKPFAGRMNKTNLARKIETKELLLLLEREINMGSDNEEDFKKSAQKILKTIKGHDKQMTELKRQIDYLEIPWSNLK